MTVLLEREFVPESTVEFSQAFVTEERLSLRVIQPAVSSFGTGVHSVRILSFASGESYRSPAETE